MGNLALGNTICKELYKIQTYPETQISDTGFVKVRYDGTDASPQEMGWLFERFLGEFLYNIYTERTRSRIDVEITKPNGKVEGNGSNHLIDVTLCDRTKRWWAFVEAKHRSKTDVGVASKILMQAASVLAQKGLKPDKLNHVGIYLIGADSDGGVQMSSRYFMEEEMEMINSSGFITTHPVMELNWMNLDDLERMYYGIQMGKKYIGYPGIVAETRDPLGKDKSYRIGETLIDSMTSLSSVIGLEKIVKETLGSAALGVIPLLKEKEYKAAENFMKGFAHDIGKERTYRRWAATQYRIKVFQYIEKVRATRMAIRRNTIPKSKGEESIGEMRALIRSNRKELYDIGHELNIRMFPDYQRRWVVIKGQEVALMPFAFYF